MPGIGVGVWLAAAFLLGSASSGDLVAHARGVRIREVGDGNPGAHNVTRELSWGAGAAVLALDAGIGATATVVPLLLGWGMGWRATAMVAVLLGHMFTPWWGFRGGVGGAVAIGTTFGLLPLGALVAAPVTLALLALTRTSIFSVWTFVAVCLVAGAWLDRDAAGAAAVVGAMVMSSARWAVLFGISDRRALVEWFERYRRRS